MRGSTAGTSEGALSGVCALARGMVDVLPLFRFQMGSQNSYFPEALADRVVVKHLPIDFRTRYEAGEVGALRAEFRRIFQVRFPHVAELLTEGWATRYIKYALRFCDTERMRVITAYKSDLFWAETGPRRAPGRP